LPLRYNSIGVVARNSMENREEFWNIADRFINEGKITQIQVFGSGNINDTFLVSLSDSREDFFVLQRINTKVFQQPELVMQNMRLVCDTIQKQIQNRQDDRRWEMPRVLLTKDDRDHLSAADGSFWRAISFIDNAIAFDTMQNETQAKEVGYGLAAFHHLICDIPPDKLADTLPGFHITPLYLQQFDLVFANSNPPNTPEVNHCLQFIRDRASFATILEDAKAEGKLPLRLMHGDPKINNILFDTNTNKAVSVIDLDTVKPGLIHYDIGDCLRSGCNLVGEETEDWRKIYFDTSLCQNILQGYFSVAKAFLTPNDCAYIFDSIRLLAFELGLRFFTDYLAGNIYFKVKHPEHNLERALVQFQLTTSIESQEDAIRQIIKSTSDRS
jgi:Ser/Thr protein kinase RdoA (MazF antagonist)